MKPPKHVLNRLELFKFAEETEENINKKRIEDEAKKLRFGINSIIAEISIIHSFIEKNPDINMDSVYNNVLMLVDSLVHKIDEHDTLLRNSRYNRYNYEFMDAEEEFSKASLVNSLIKLSDELDKDDLTKYANFVDSLIKKIS